MTPVGLAIVALSCTIGVSVLFAVEKRRGARILPRVRRYADGVLDHMYAETFERMPRINKEFFHQLFHYAVHRTLSRCLRVLARIERAVRTIVHLNRKRAIERRSQEGGADTHLQAIAAHKEEVALSPKEQHERKEAALKGDTPTARSKKRVAPE